MKHLPIELKICEACGVLWLRRKHLDGSYCVRCSSRLSAFPAPAEKRGGGRPTTRIRRSHTRRACASRAGAR